MIVTDKKRVGKPPRNPNTTRFTIDAYLTPQQIAWFESRGKTKAATLIAMIEKGMGEDKAIEDIKVSIEIDGEVRVYQPAELIA
jgi:hypothetical protein